MKFNDGEKRGLGDLRGRFLFFIIFIGAVFAFYSIYVFSLQVVKGSVYKKRAEEVARRIISIQPQRGEIYDRHYDVPLVLNIDSYAVDVIPGELEDGEIDELVARLAEVLNLPEEKIKDKIPENYTNVFTPVEIKEGVSYRQIIGIAENIEDFPAVQWHKKMLRSYLETGSISHILGYVGTINREELQIMYNKGYNQNSVIGKNGIERYYDDVLRGKPGKIFTTVDVKGRSIGSEERTEVPPEPGDNLVLTIDRDIQKLCEKALGERNGSIVAMKPGTGEVLAMVSYPWYDPNIFYSDEAEKEITRLSLDPNYPFLNRAIQSSYSPASMFKIIMTTAIINEEALPVTKEIVCTGDMFFGDRKFHCHRTWGHGPVDLFTGLAESCNIYFWTAGQELGVQRIVDYANRFGLGKLTGIDIPGEVRGLVPNPTWKENTYNAKWLGGDTMNISIGQGYLTVTPIQVANVVSLIVNEGTVYKPHILKQVRDPISGNIVMEQEPEILHTTNIPAETFVEVKKAMRGVITEGTANVVITTEAVDIAGKTGTGQVGLSDRWSSWFTAYGPYQTEDPEERIVLVVMVEATNDWEWWAPKAANIVFQALFADQTYEEAVDALNLWYIDNQ